MDISKKFTIKKNRKESLSDKLSAVPKYVWILGLILVAGIFLRTYQFHDMLRFNADQARDAMVVSGFLEGESEFPLLGPKAGGTEFKLGGMFYHFQIISAWIFGNWPDKMAYPDLFFSILAIPLLFLFLRKYFDMKFSLMLTAIFAVSFYAIKYSRFAWNPNSTPFWTMLFLYGLHELMMDKSKRKWLWAVLVGTALGVGVQLHTLLLIFMPLTIFAVSIYLIVKKRQNWKYVVALIAIGFLLNSGQIYSEIKTGGQNTKAFFKGADKKEEKGDGIVLNLVKNANCSIQSNAYILTSYNMSDECELKAVTKKMNIFVTLLSAIFFIGGIILAVLAFKKEKDDDKKKFLALIGGYVLLSFLILIPLANEISMRFYLVQIFLPFLLLGIWLKSLSQWRWTRSHQMMIVIAVVTMLILLNLAGVGKMFFNKYSDGFDIVTLGELEKATNFVVDKSVGAEKVFVTGNSQFIFKGLKGMQYLASKSGVKIAAAKKEKKESHPLFLIESAKHKEKTLESEAVEDYLDAGRLTVYELGSTLKLGFVTDFEYGYKKKIGNKLTSRAPEELEKIVKFFNEEFHPEIVIEGGDMVESSLSKRQTTINQFNEINAIFSKLQAKRGYVFGNHDLRDLSKSELTGILGMENSHGYFDLGDWRFVLMDTNFEKDGSDLGPNFYVGGRVSESEFSWLREAFQTEKPIMLFSHHSPMPVMTDGKLNTNNKNLINGLEVHNFLKQFPNLVLVLSGHDPSFRFNEFEGVNYLIVDNLANIDSVGSFASIEAKYGKSTKEAKIIIEHHGPSYKKFKVQKNIGLQ